MKQDLTVQIDGKDQNIIAEIIDKKLWFKVNGETFSYGLVELLQSTYGRSSASTKSPDKLISPMPGKITKIFVTPEQKVKKGDTLVVMEAMKMEYTLKSAIDGRVVNLNVQPGQQVILGALLIQLEESKP